VRGERAVCTRNGEMAKKNRSFSFSRSARSLQQNASNAGAVAAASYTLVGGIILLGGLGYLFDKWQGTGPWGLLIGLALGIIVGFYDLVKTTTTRR
jgi:F0F1-type ATP synthase assembly protein I